MGRKNRNTFPGVPSERQCSTPGLHQGESWDQKQLNEKYIKELEARYKELNSKKRTGKSLERPGIPVKSKTSRAGFDYRCSARPNSASSTTKPQLVLNDHMNRSAYKEMDESERFFALIRDTVTEVVQKKLDEVVGEHFQGIFKRIEHMASKLTNTENGFNSLQQDLNNKLNHYGEEHSRHFRYICMKMEYDKIFYQHMNGHMRPENLNKAYTACGQSMAQDLMNFQPPYQLRTCACSSRYNAKVSPAHRDTSNAGLAGGNTTPKPAMPVNSNSSCCNFNDNHNQKPTTSTEDKQNFSNGKVSSELNLRDILATIKQYYPISDDFAEKLGKGTINLDDDQSDEASSPGQSDEFSTPDIMNVKRQQAIKRLG